MTQSFFSKEEFRITINKCNNLSIPRPDHIFWKHLKAVVKDDKCLSNIVNIVNMWINLGHWLTHLKISPSIIIPKSYKVAYNLLKTFRQIVLLNTLVKLIKKVISERLQFQSIFKDFIHSNQFGGLKQQLTTDTSIFLMYLICSG